MDDRQIHNTVAMLVDSKQQQYNYKLKSDNCMSKINVYVYYTPLKCFQLRLLVSVFMIE